MAKGQNGWLFIFQLSPPHAKNPFLFETRIYINLDLEYICMKSTARMLIGPSDLKPSRTNFRVRGIFNPAAIRLADGRIMLLARVAETPLHGERYFLAPRFAGRDRLKMVIETIPRHKCRWDKDCFRIHGDIARLPTISHMRKIILDKDGLQVDHISQRADFYGLVDDGDFGVEDPRITFLQNEKRYAMTYVSVSALSGVSTSLAISRDLESWERKGIIFRQQNKDVAIFPQKINGYYVALQRPEGTMIFDKPSIWISYSKDMQFWGKDRPLLRPREGSWEEVRIGPGTVPIKTAEGWLHIYHGVRYKQKGNDSSPKIYSAGAILFSLENPEKILSITPKDEPLFCPESGFETQGFVNNVIFPTAAVSHGKDLLIYSGAADSNIEVRKIAIKEILNSLG